MRESLVELLNKVLAVYKQLQWSKVVVVGGTNYRYCPLCDQPEGKGHATSCPCTALNEDLLAYGQDMIRDICEKNNEVSTNVAVMNGSSECDHSWDGPEVEIHGYKKGENPISSLRVLGMTKTCSKCGMKLIDYEDKK